MYGYLSYWSIDSNTHRFHGSNPSKLAYAWLIYKEVPLYNNTETVTNFYLHDKERLFMSYLFFILFWW